jgi:hypothetical protein
VIFTVIDSASLLKNFHDMKKNYGEIVSKNRFNVISKFKVNSEKEKEFILQYKVVYSTGYITIEDFYFIFNNADYIEGKINKLRYRDWEDR